MKKIVVISLAFVFALSNVFAQEAGKGKGKLRKDYTRILPHAGDFAIGLDLADFVKSINNSITNPLTGNTVVAFQSDFFGKYFVTNKSAIRARLGIYVNDSTDRVFIRDDNAFLSNPMTQSNPLLEEKTVDVFKSRFTTVELGIGYEFRRSLWRVQGYVGVEAFGGMMFSRTHYQYGNPMTKENQQPTIGYNTGGYGYRILESKSNGFTFGAAAFIGADFYICRNLSIGAEFSLEGRYYQMGENLAKSETWMLEQAYVAEERYKPVTSAFYLAPTGRLNLMIHIAGCKKQAPNERQDVFANIPEQQQEAKVEKVEEKKEKEKPCYTIEEMKELISANKSITGKKICAIKQIQFETGKSVLTKSDKDYLSAIVDLMNQNKQIRIKINGHTDNVGSEEVNMNLSKNRAKAVYDYMIKKGGISADRLSYEYFGMSKPIADNDTEEGRATNRRVEFEIL